MKQTLAAVILSLSLAMPGAALSGPIREIEISPDPVQGGKQVFTVRIRPSETHVCERIVIECAYHQELPWVDASGASYTKTNEPAAFTYRRPDVRLVDDLDCFISFTVPVSLARLRETYGPTLFDPAQPITISRLRIDGISDGVAKWSYVLEARGLHRVAE